MTHANGHLRARAAPIAAVLVAIAVPILALVVIVGLVAAFFRFMYLFAPTTPPPTSHVPGPPWQPAATSTHPK